jgi:hypothetical protein
VFQQTREKGASCALEEHTRTPPPPHTSLIVCSLSLSLSLSCQAVRILYLLLKKAMLQVNKLKQSVLRQYVERAQHAHWLLQRDGIVECDERYVLSVLDQWQPPFTCALCRIDYNTPIPAIAEPASASGAVVVQEDSKSDAPTATTTSDSTTVQPPSEMAAAATPTTFVSRPRAESIILPCCARLACRVCVTTHIMERVASHHAINVTCPGMHRAEEGWHQSVWQGCSACMEV